MRRRREKKLKKGKRWEEGIKNKRKGKMENRREPGWNKKWRREEKEEKEPE